MTNITALISGIASILVCCLSAYIIRINQNTDLKRLENRKRNRLIFSLLELKFWIDKEVDLNQKLEQFLNVYELEVAKHVTDITPADFREMRVTVMTILKQQLLIHSEIPALEENIESIIRELAEVDPVFAFELTGRYQITAHTARIQALIVAAGTPPEEDSHTPHIIVNDILRPQMLKDLQKELVVHIPMIAKKTDRRTYKELQTLPPSSTDEIDMNGLREVLKDLIPQLLAARRPVA